MSKKYLAWHFLAENKKLGYGDDRIIRKGVTYKCNGKPDLCNNGMHGSIHAFDALSFAPGPIISRVEIWGDVQKADDKIVGTHRKVLWVHDMSKELRLFACACARDVWHLLEDERSKQAVIVAEKYAKGKASRDELAAAWDAARDAAWDAAGAAARDAAWDAAWDAARDAAWDAAGAAWDAAGAAAWDAAGAKQRKRFSGIMNKLDREFTKGPK